MARRRQPKPEKAPVNNKPQTLGELYRLWELGQRFGEPLPTTYGKPGGCTRFKINEERVDWRVVR